MHRVAGRPGPATEFGAPVIGKGLRHFGLGIHYKRAILRYRFADGATLQHQQFAGGIAIHQFQGILSPHFGDGLHLHAVPADVQACSAEEIQLPARGTVGRWWERQTRPGCDMNRPDRHIRVALAGPRGRWRWQAARAAAGRGEIPGHHPYGAGATWCIAEPQALDLLIPQHGEVRFGHFIFGRQVQPDLE